MAEKPEQLQDVLGALFADPNRALLDPEEIWWGKDKRAGGAGDAEAESAGEDALQF